MSNIVYIVRVCTEDDEDWIQGIFSTQELAVKCIESGKYNGRYFIIEWGIDSNRKDKIKLIEKWDFDE